MNSFIENANALGGQFVTFAWPMLWQSSLLIALVLVVDWSLARKVRASVRHALWLVVLVKLLLPPTLALPTGVAWWLFPAKPIVKTPVTRNYTVTFDNPMPLPALTQETVVQPVVLPPSSPPRPKLDGLGWTLLGCSLVSVTLLAWLLFRWWQLARTIRAAVAPNQLETVMVTARRRAQLPPGIHLKLVEKNMSPAVCGLFRPVILLPRRLVENLSVRQLQAVLLHEAIHLRRKDIWVNCAQALLQIVYWWHPLVWVANARIRRVREEAVDDAVMLALAGDAETYAPTLLEVAKLALNRPLMSLGIVGIVGIMETRSALRQRIERLVNFRAPRKAGLTFLSLCGIFVFSAVAVPMGQGPARVISPAATPVHSSNGTNTSVFSKNTLPTFTGILFDPNFRVALQALKQRSWIEHLGEPEITTISGQGTSLRRENVAEIYYSDPEGHMDHVEKQWILPQNASMSSQWGAEVANSPVPNTDATNMFGLSSPTRWDILAKLDQIHLESVAFNGLPLNEVLKQLSEQTKQHDPEHKGINFLITNGTNGQDVGSYIIKMPILTNVRLADVLDGILLVTDHPLKYSIRDFAVFFSEKTPEAPQLFTQTFRVDTNTFYSRWGSVSARSVGVVQSDAGDRGGEWKPSWSEGFLTDTFDGGDTGTGDGSGAAGGLAYVTRQASAPTLGALGRAFFGSMGVNLTNPPGKVVFYNRLGLLFVKATKSDLDTIQHALQAINALPTSPSGVQGGDLRSEPEVSTTTGRQTRMRATSVDQNILQDVQYQPNTAQTDSGAPSSPVQTSAPAHTPDRSSSPAGAANAVHTGPGRQAIMAKLDRIQLESVSYNGLPLKEVLKQLSEQAKLYDPEHKGINFLINDNPNLSAHPLQIDIATGQPVTTSDTEQPDIGAAIIKIPNLTDVRLADVLDAVVLTSDHPIRYSIQEFGIMFYAKDPESPQLFTRTFRVDPNTFYSGLESVSAKNVGAVQSGGGAQNQNNGAVVGGVNAFPKAKDIPYTGGGDGPSGNNSGGGGNGTGGEKIPQSANNRTYATTQKSTSTPSTLARAFFTSLGVNLNDPAGKSVFFNDKLGLLFVKATETDLETIEQALRVISTPPPQIHIKVRFVEVPQNDDKGLGFDWWLGQFNLGNQTNSAGSASPSLTMPGSVKNSPGVFPGKAPASTNLPNAINQLATNGPHYNTPTLGTFTGILTDSNFRVTLHALSQRSGVEVLGEPEVTTLSGRQTQMRATHTITVITNLTADLRGLESAVEHQVSTNEIGPVIDIVPYVLADGSTINLSLIPSDTEFDGYGTPTIPGVSPGQIENLNVVQFPTIFPKFTTNRFVTTINIWDNQTVVLGGLTTSTVTSMKDKVPVVGDVPVISRLFQSQSTQTNRNNLLIFITATIVDPAGSRVHTDAEIPDSVPLQPAASKPSTTPPPDGY